MSRRRGFTLIELLIALLIISVLAAMVFPVFSRARDSARKATCLSNVLQLGTALQLYGADFGGQLPPRDNDWMPLDPYVRNLSILRCPNDPAGEVDSDWHESGWPVAFDSSYVYRSGLATDDLPYEIIGFDERVWHLGGRNVLVLDGHARWVVGVRFWTYAPDRILELDPSFAALTVEQQEAVRKGEAFPGELPWR
jgi:prepilin-type N-terminal cleavage/methylation domain-containing protein/prepilin-type processing-associated H-X9-DG protein